MIISALAHGAAWRYGAAMGRAVQIVVVIGLLVGCGVDPASRASLSADRTILVFCDSGSWAELEAPLRAALADTIATPAPEPWFVVRRGSLDEWDLFSRYGMVLLVGDLEGHGPIRDRIRSLCSPTTLAGIASGEVYFVTESDLWSHPQQVGILAAPTGTELRSRLMVNGAGIRAVFENFSRRVVESRVFDHTETELEERIRREMGVEITIPSRYELRHLSPETGTFALWRRRLREDRMILVQVRPGYSFRRLDDRCRVWRNEIVEEVYEGDQVRTEGLETEPFGEGVRLRGLWENHRAVMGGPFETWCVPDAGGPGTLLVDLAVFAPGEDKVPAMQELRAIAASIRVLWDRQ